MEDLQTLRKRIDEIDIQILKALSERIDVCQKIGEQKKQQNLPLRDVTREREIYGKVKDRAVEFHLDPSRVELVYHEIVNMCIDIQKQQSS